MNFENLYNIRENLNLTQEKMAEHLEVKRSTYANWEVNIATIPLNKLIDFTNFTKTSLDYIIKLDNKNNYAKIFSEKIIVEENIKRFRNIENITQKQLAQKLNTIQTTIFAYEIGTTLINTTFLYEICKKYNISMDWFCKKH